MAQAEAIKPSHRAIEKYYQALRRLSGEHVTHELGLRSAFQSLLEDTAKLHGWSFIAELPVARASLPVASHGLARASLPVASHGVARASLPVASHGVARASLPLASHGVARASLPVASHGLEGRATIRPDGTIRDGNSLPRGCWEAKDTPLSYRVEKMKLNKEKTVLWVNNSLSLAGIPPEVFEYRLGNRSALDWVIDQYQVSEDKRSGIKSDPNRPDDQEYIVRLVGQVVRVSVETVKLVNSLPQSYD